MNQSQNGIISFASKITEDPISKMIKEADLTSKLLKEVSEAKNPPVKVEINISVENLNTYHTNLVRGKTAVMPQGSTTAKKPPVTEQHTGKQKGAVPKRK